MKSLYLLLVTLVISVVSCRTKDGAPGPAGESSLMQQGFISGTITYTGNNGNVSVPFNYQYFESLSDNKFYYYVNEGDYYEASFTRIDQKDDYNGIHFELSGDSDAGVESDPTDPYMYFRLITFVNNELVVFNGYSPTITNVNLDPATGRLTFDYTGSVDSYYGGATVTGKVDVILNRSPKNVIESPK